MPTSRRGHETATGLTGTTPVTDWLDAWRQAAPRDETGALSRRGLLPGSTRLVLSQLPPEGTLGEAMEIVANAYNMLHGGEFNRVVRHGGEVAFVTDERGFPFAVEKPAEVRVVMEATLLFAHALLRLIAPGVAGPSLHCVRLRRPKGPAAVPFERLAEVRYGAKAYALVYDRAAAEGERVRFPPPGALTFEAVGEEQARLLHEAPAPVTDAVREALSAEDVGQDEVALALDMSPATLRRHLQAEGTSFRALRAAALTARATAFLRSDLALPSIAARLGFSDVRSFNRAFKAWTGVTPAAARRQLR